MAFGRVLFVDAYDSFSHNIVNLLKDRLGVEVESVYIDDARYTSNRQAWLQYLDGFDGVVAGPGPGHPATADDVGLIASLWTLPNDHLLPVLGICLGFQSFALTFGATVERLREPRHGLVTPVTHAGRDIFADTGDVRTTQYHSLSAKAGHSASQDASALWKTASQCPELTPLAWDLSDESNGPILMSVRHSQRPYWGVQYHPESICTNAEGHKLISNWWQLTQRFNETQRRTKLDSPVLAAEFPRVNGVHHQEPTPRASEERVLDDASSSKAVQHVSFAAESGVDVATIAELMRHEDQQPILLESGTRAGKPLNPETGRYSILGVQGKSSLNIRYSCASRSLRIEANGSVVLEKQAAVEDVFDLLDSVMKKHAVAIGPAETPFWGGLIGFVSYEAGLETLNVATDLESSAPVDMWFVMVERSIVIDHVQGKLYVQSILADDDSKWLQSTQDTIAAAGNPASADLRSDTPVEDVPAKVISEPAKGDYCSKVKQCQECLRAGESYELCLTGQTQVSSAVDSWALYRHLRDTNPAPFGSYLHLKSSDDVGFNIVSSSPERFLSWSRQGRCEFRPIKGTVKKTPEMTREKATALLACEKEQAENLMIVDLIRHDLSGVEG